MSAAQKMQEHPVFIQAQNKAHHYVSQLDKELSKYPVLIRLEQRTQVPKSYLVLGTIIIVSILHTFNPLAAPVSNLVGWVVPAYFSFKTLEKSARHEDHDDVQWLTYWVVFGFFNFLESFAIRLVLYYVPWYYVFKTIFIVWLQMPGTRGAQTTYFTILKPVLSNLSSQNRVVAPTTTSADAHQE